VAAKFFYIRTLDGKPAAAKGGGPRRSWQRPQGRAAPGVGLVSPIILVCECGTYAALDVFISAGPECYRCGEPLLPDEVLLAASAVARLGGDQVEVLRAALIPDRETASKRSGGWP
jgi:hypothetical protein